MSVETNLDGLPLETLKQIVSDPEQVQRQLMAVLRTLRSEDEEQRAWASDCLQQVAEPPLEFGAELAALCMDDCEPLADWACRLLGRIGGNASPWQNHLAEALREHPAMVVRQSAAAALGKIPELSVATREALCRAANSSDPRLKRLATQSLAED
ncbi:MAG: HEAT repeat domain-containing protein [Pirellulaceae bacterium]